VRIDRLTAERAAALAPRVALLEQLDFFASASRPILERLAGLATAESIPAGTAVVREGDTADAVYVLAEGEADVTARDEARLGEQAIRHMTAPSYFGEIGVLARVPRTATVTAATDLRVLRLDGRVLVDVLTSAPPSSSLMENARTRLARTHPARTLAFTPPEPVEPR
jgi:CRP-like cAMP-binding protein